jgi:hypothetical protein
MGRFTTADPDGGSINPQDPQSWNRYTYTRNNPVNAVDATGYSDFLLGRFGTCDLFDPAEIEFTGSLISETGMAGCPPWSRPDPSYRQQRFVPGNIDVTAIGADGMYYIMHNTQAGTIPVFTVETVLVVGGRVLVTVVGKVALPITIAAVGAGLVYYYWDDIIEGIEGARDEIIRDIVRSGCPPSENFNNPEIQPRPGFDKVYNTDGSITWLNRATGEYLRPDLTHGPPIGPHWDFRIMFPNGFYEIWRCFKDKAPEFKERGRRWWDSIIQ